jgi:hypothetical protein
LLESGTLWLPEAMATSEDRAWTWRLHLEAPSYAVVDAPGVFYRRGNADSLTGVFDDRRLGFIEAARRINALLDSDPDRDRFLPKVVRSALALTGFHRGHRRQMPRHLRRNLTEQTARLLLEFPASVVEQQIATSPAYRRQLIGPVIRRYRALGAAPPPSPAAPTADAAVPAPPPARAANSTTRTGVGQPGLRHRPEV